MNVIIKSDGGPSGTRVFTEAGEDISRKVTAVSFRAEVADVTRAELTLNLVSIDAVAQARAYVGGKEVRRVEYADGTVDEFGAD